ncbi:MAG: stage V sporulation protein AC [Clostridia bacterium]|nr:stage V sporulation protein AC [Clostridia bacterium]
MELKQKAYQKMVEKKSPKSKIAYDCLKAFWVGGTICLVGEIISNLLSMFFTLEKTSLSAWTSIILVFLGATLTGIGVYDKIGKYAGAGSLVPITGFANGITSPAMEYKPEGFVLGVGAKMFTIAGPVIVYGTVASVIYGIIYWITTLF